MVVVGDNRIFGAFAYQLNVLDPRGNYQLLFIRAVLDINCHRVIHKSADRFHCFLNIAVISCPVACDDQRIFALLLLRINCRLSYTKKEN